MPKRKDIEYELRFEKALQVAENLRTQRLAGVNKEEYEALVDMLVLYFKSPVELTTRFYRLKWKKKDFEDRFDKSPLLPIRKMLAMGYPDTLEKAQERHRKNPTAHSASRFVETKAAIGNPNASPQAIKRAHEEDLRHIELARFQIRSPQIITWDDLVVRIAQSVLMRVLAQQGEKIDPGASTSQHFDEKLAVAVVQKLKKESLGQIPLDIYDHRIRTAIAIARSFLITEEELPEIESVCLNFPLSASQEDLINQAGEILDYWQTRFVKFRGKKVPQRKGQHLCEPWLLLADQLSKDEPLRIESRPPTRDKVIASALKTIEENDPGIWGAIRPALEEYLRSSAEKSRSANGQD